MTDGSSSASDHSALDAALVAAIGTRTDLAYTPPPNVLTYSSAIDVSTMADLGSDVYSDNMATAAEHKKLLAAETERWGSLIRSAGVFAD